MDRNICTTFNLTDFFDTEQRGNPTDAEQKSDEFRKNDDWIQTIRISDGTKKKKLLERTRPLNICKNFKHILRNMFL